tara:strand:+ start:2553 stop:2939 length:387 start_codon:yes stop_codon:yes gene_type:complete
MKLVGALIIKDECLLLNVNPRSFAHTYSFPLWEMTKGYYPIEFVNNKLNDSFGIKTDRTIYIEMVDFYGNNLYLYKIKNWKTILARGYTCSDDISKMVWIHKDVLLKKHNSVYFDNDYIKKIFEHEFY